ncbi:bicyclomycin/multidrug efflux system [Helicobacter muridarum]|uniref:Bicyclomycin/multidrug efflux system n=1 Tax=Helicobacter muridarum TaxID=216 RepID=A0A377PT79_9HELI|nr:bicyclomycin/multidrug efflux system [Helicobacter muridarum]
MSYVIGGALAMSAMFAYITGSSFVFINVFDLSRNAYGIIFAINAFGFVICSSINAKIVFKSSPATISKNAFIAMCIFAALLVLVGIIWHYSLFLSSNNIYLIAFELMLFTTISMLGFLLPNLTTLAMARFKQCSGMASAILGTTQFSLAGIISFLVGVFGANTPLLLAIMMFGAILFGSAVFFSLKK